MTTARIFGCLAAGFALLGCGTPGGNTGVSCVRPDEAAEISGVVRARTPTPIDSYEREPDGTVVVWMRTIKGDPYYGATSIPFHGYIVRRVKGKWQMIGEKIRVL